MLRIRMVEDRIVELYPEQEIRCPTHLCTGQEAIAAGVCANLIKEDCIYSTHRCHGHYIAKGGNIKMLMAELYGRLSGCCRGKGGSMHLAQPDVGMMGSSAIVGGIIPLAVGTALAFAMRSQARVSVAFFGDAATEQGTFYESLNFSALKRLPVLFVCENNLYATQSHISARQVTDNIYERANLYKIPGIRVDGNDVVEVYKASREAVQRCREGGGPSLIECRTYRWKEHVGPNFDYNLGYRSKDELEYWIKRCPIKALKEVLLTSGILSQDELDTMAGQVDSEVQEAVRFAKQGRFPDPSEIMQHVY
jgi:pyruvate dehydrogenase E1 component alpha subunit